MHVKYKDLLVPSCFVNFNEASYVLISFTYFGEQVIGGVLGSFSYLLYFRINHHYDDLNVNKSPIMGILVLIHMAAPDILVNL